MTINSIIKGLKAHVKSPFSLPWVLLGKIICKIRSIYYSQKIDSGGGRIIITSPFLRFNIRKLKTSQLHIEGNFRIVSRLGGKASSNILLSPNSILRINGDFVIGHGVRIFLSKDSSLKIGGKDKESDSGITSDTLIMVSNRIEIGKDFICAWNIFISDSDWHQIEGVEHQKDIIIGDHVWVANSTNVLKGAIVGDNSIIASHSKVINKEYPANVILAGTPAKIVKTGIKWRRDLN